MSIVDKMKSLIGDPWEPPEDWDATELIYIMLPMDLDPEDRADHYGDAIDAELRLHRLGYVSGGGTMLSDENPDGSRDLEFCGIDAYVVDVDRGREVLRNLLPSLGCPAGTDLEFHSQGANLQDEYDGSAWAIGRPSPPPRR